MQNQTVARRYATAIFELARERGAIEAVGRELRAAADAIRSDDDLRRFFTSPVIDRPAKSAALTKALARFDEIALHAVLLLVRKRREALLEPIVVEYEALALAESGKVNLEIRSARKLPAEELERIVTRLSRVYGKTFVVKTAIDPALLGGVRISLNDRRIDGSIAGRLDEFARELHRQKELSA
jgi:F-type H+-transporting ATPase subunit delta